MARSAPLRAVSVDEQPAGSPVLTVSQAAAAGDRRALLVAMRDRVARSVESDGTSARDLAALTRRLIEIDDLILAIDAAHRRDPVSEAAATPDEGWDAAAI